jgi:outer membrane murein-binding lipoprotein Lpp
MLELEDLKSMQDKAYTHNQVPREKAADDMVFYWVSQWDDNLLSESQLQFRGEFNILRKAGRQIMSDLKANPVQVDFDPKDEGREDGAELLDGLYRSTDRANSSIESYWNAANESIVCGVGAWELYTDYETSRGGDTNQVIKRRPIYEANNKVFWDPNAKMLDKSDAKYCAVLHAYSKSGYDNLVEELTGDESECSDSSFASPEMSYTFPWVAGDEQVYVVDFYHKERVKDKVFTMVDPFGQELKIRNSDFKEEMDDLIYAGYEVVSEKEIKRWQVTKYIASGERILKSDVIAGEHIPVVPQYGERAFVEGQEWYEGVTRLAKDPQRLRNFQMSYLADIVSRSPRPKPIFYPEQIQGFEFMYEEAGADNNLPYYLQQRKDSNGVDLPLGPVAQMPEQNVPQGLMLGIELTRQAVEDVANPGLPQNLADPDLSGKAVIALQNRMDMQSMVYQENKKHAKRRDGEIFASMACDVYDTPRKATVTMPDGQRKKVDIMEMIMDEKTGEIKYINDLTNTEFDVYADIGPSYSNQKEQTTERLGEMIGQLQPGDPIRDILMLKYLKLMDGVDFDDVREYANKQLIVKGIKEPETDEEIAMMEQMKQAQQGQPDAMMIAAQAEMEKAKADQMDAQTKAMSAQVDQFNAETKRMEAQVKAAEAGVRIDNTKADTMGKMISNQGKQIENIQKSNPYRASL